ncbi:MAG: agmatinase [Candidatus Parabeggiatoa sp. nov. 1]|nr:MAG: agmatinase [Gammaproteobacteria bacterium]
MAKVSHNPAIGAHLFIGGIPTFMRQPASRDLEGVEVAIIGIPFDGGTLVSRSGTRSGPLKIREASLDLFKGCHPIFKVDPFDKFTRVDYGDVAVEPLSMEDTLKAIQEEVGAVLVSDTTVIALGGDHSITLPLLRTHAAKFGPLAVIHFDAHPDTADYEVSHATSFYHAIKEKLIDTEAYIQVGIRGPSILEDVEAARALGAQVLTIDECFAMGIPAVIQKITELMGRRRVYVSFDIDSVDPAYAPGTGSPEIGGFTSYQILQMVRGLAGLNLVGFDLVEVCPSYDHGEITSILAANLVLEFLSLLAVNKSKSS